MHVSIVHNIELIDMAINVDEAVMNNSQILIMIDVGAEVR
jgi:hypothetical protein